MKADRIADLLPDVVKRTVVDGTVMAEMLDVMEELHRPVEDVLADFSRFLDPYRCPSRFVPLLAHWMGFGWLVANDDGVAPGSTPSVIGEDALRNLVFHATALAKNRGTRWGLTTTLNLATGAGPFTVADMAGRPFTIEVRGPAEAHTAQDLVHRIIAHEKPAFVTAFVAFGTDDPVAVDDSSSQPSESPYPSPSPGEAP